MGLAQIWRYVEHRRSWEIGFAVLPEYGGRGYGTETASLLLRFAFEHLDAHKVVGMCNSHNTRSAALLERIGAPRLIMAPLPKNGPRFLELVLIGKHR
ncbi:hypothetical protein DLM86_30085 [Paenibacillus flagellatus]|uniref:N-acetyltransferase domain-containing protein n=1 Tax=Paenibacillus flagellatus TaxID=2211139 RepID=A0A2V5JV54_9BACL|nr:hypothetical protein DLM86_30085 [Paenibacillus flagellatus]